MNVGERQSLRVLVGARSDWLFWASRVVWEGSLRGWRRSVRWLDGDRRLGAGVDLQELVEEGAVVEHGGAHVFGGDLGAGGALRDGVGGAVVFDDAGMVDRDVGGALLEVDDGIAAGVHEGGDELVGLDDGAAGVVDEAGLDELPLVEEALAFGGGEVVDVEAVDALFAGCEGGLGVALGAAFEDRALVLGAEASAQMLGLLAALWTRMATTTAMITTRATMPMMSLGSDGLSCIGGISCEEIDAVSCKQIGCDGGAGR